MNDSKKMFDGALLSVALAAVLVSVMAVIGMITRPTVVAVPGGDGGAPAEVRAHLTLTEFAIEGDLRVPPGDLVIELHNDGGIQHNLQFDGGEISPMVNSGDSLEFRIGEVAPGDHL